MKPFNLNDFKAGKKVVTRDGRDVKQLTVFDAKNIYTVLGVVNGQLENWRPNGRWSETTGESKLNLFHPDEEMYLVVYTSIVDGKKHTSSVLFEKPEEVKGNSTLYKLVKVD